MTVGTKKTLRVGVIGLGFGADHAREFAACEGVELVAVAEPWETTRAKQLPKIPASPKVYDDGLKMIRSEKLDIVAIASPDWMHAEHSVAALEAGAHVLVEKPMCDTLDDARAMVETVERTGLRLAVGHEVRQTPMYVRAKALVRDGTLGRLCYGESCYLHNFEDLINITPWRAERRYRVFTSGACHPVDLLRYFFGDVAEVHAYSIAMSKILHAADPDTIVALLKFDSGAIGRVIGAGGVKRGYELSLRLYGDRGTFEGDNEHAEARLSVEKGVHNFEVSTVTASIDSHAIRFEDHNIVAAARTGAPVLVDVYEGANCVSVCEAIRESARSGRTLVPHRFVRPEHAKARYVETAAESGD
jgi:predicted dehydrogenase